MSISWLRCCEKMVGYGMLSIDKAKIAQRFSKASHSYTEQAVIQKKICQHLMHLILQSLVQKNDVRIFEIGCGSGNLSHLLLENFQISEFILNDLYADVQRHFENDDLNHGDFFQSNPKIKWLIGDIEQLIFPNQLDVIASSSVLQWISDLDNIFTKSAIALKPEGYLCFSTFGQFNLQEIKDLTGQGLDYLDLESIRKKLEQQGFEIIHLDENIETLYFDHPQAVLQHLKATGVTATASKHRWTKQSLTQFYQDYEKFSVSDENHTLRYSLTYHPIYCIARRKP